MLIAHTPDADDAFMFYAMLSGKVKTVLKFDQIVEDIETLNRLAMEGKPDLTAISAHAYAYVHDRYRIISVGASVGDGYGPIVVSKSLRSLKGAKIAVPGRYTTAFLLLKLALEEFRPVEVRFDRIIDEVVKGNVDAGLLIHEGQITYEDYGLKKVIDLWEFWRDQTSLPLPLGVNVIRRDLPEHVQMEAVRVMRESVKYALENVEEALDYASRYSRGLDRDRMRRFVLMYVNRYTVDMPPEVVKALNLMFEMAEEKGILKKPKIDVLGLKQ